MFLEELGIEQSGLDQLVRAAYDLLGLATYFTAGEQEVRAWTFTQGMKAPECAGIIHTDFERGFHSCRNGVIRGFISCQNNGSSS